jgi:CBS domain containing-hemolysin-like protein
MRRDRRHILLVSDGRVPLGVVTLDDVLHAVVGEQAATPTTAARAPRG